MYEMLFGYPPFYHTDKDRNYELILSAELKFDDNYIQISDECKDLISKLLDKNPETRIGGSKDFLEIKMHPFFSSVNFEALMNQELNSPYVPSITNKYDLSFFADEYICQELNDSIMELKESKRVENYKNEFDEMLNIN